jgi:polysaccharide export outer membrane protein
MSFRSLLARLAIGCCLAASAPLCATAAPAPTAAPAAGKSDADTAYVLGPEDVIDVQVLGRTDFHARPKIGQDGTVPLPFIGTMSASNMTTNQFADAVKHELESKGFFSNPIISVEIVGYASRYVTVLGEVARPGVIPVDKPLHLSELLARVGGVRDTASDYLVVRPEKGAEHRLAVDALARGDASQDPLVLPGDKVFSPKAELFYISGQVNRAGPIKLEPDMTLRTGIAAAGGLTALGSDKGVKVTHVGGKKGKLKLEDKIQAGDVIVVGERLF